MNEIPVNERFTLTVREAAQYYRIGEKKIRHLADANPGAFAVKSGNRNLIIRTRFEDFLLKNSAI